MNASVLGKDGVGGSIPLGGTTFPHISCASANRDFRVSAHVGRGMRNSSRTPATESVHSVPATFHTYYEAWSPSTPPAPTRRFRLVRDSVIMTATSLRPLAQATPVLN